MAKSNGLTHILAELSPLDELSVLTARSARLKYTCLSVSRKYIALGSNTGGVYIFSRDTLKYLQVVFADSEANPVVCVSLPSSDQHVGVALSTGLVAVFELNIDKRIKPERIRSSQDHSGHLVSSITWDTACSKMFVGDNTGKLSIVFVPSVKGKTLFAGPSEVIAYLSSAICQMEWWKDKLLVSTATHTHLFDTLKHNYSTIGTKPRDGEFGACYFLEPSSQVPVVYCARPGSRMWEVDFEGKVLNTHQFKQLLATPSVPVIKLWEEHLDSVISGKITSQSVNFFKMLRIGQFIVTWSLKGVYIFDPINVKVVVWTESFKGIKDISVINNDIYLFLDKTEVHKLSLLPVYQLFTVLSLRKRWSLMSSLLLSADLINIRPAIMKRVNQDLLQTLLAGLKEEGKLDMVEKVQASMEDLSEGSIESLSACDDFMDTGEVMGYTYLPSGMVVVSEGVQIRDFKPRTGDIVQKTAETFESQNVGIDRVYTQKYDSEVDTDNNKKEEAENMVEENNESIDFSSRQLTEQNEHIVADLIVDCKVENSDCTNEHDVQENLHQKGQNKIFLSEDTPICSSSVTVSEHEITDRELASSDPDMRDSRFSSNESDAHEKLTNIVCSVEIVKTFENHQVNSNSHENSTSDMDNGNDCKEFSEISIQNGHLEAEDTQMDLDEFKNNTILDSQSDVCKYESENITGNTSESSNLLSVSPSAATDKNMNFKNTSSLYSSHDIIIDCEEMCHSNSDADWPVTTGEKTVTKAEPSLCETETSENNSGNVTSMNPAYQECNVSEPTLSYSVDHSNGLNEVLKEKDATNDKFQHNILNAAFASKRENIVNKVKTDARKSTKKFSQIDFSSTQDDAIAQPLKTGKKRKTKKLSENKTRSASLDIYPYDNNKGSLRSTVSVGDEPEEMLFDDIKADFDAMSITTISSIEEEDDVMLPGRITPDSLSSAGDLYCEADNKKSTFEYSVSPPGFKDKQVVRKNSGTLSYTEAMAEVIPPLIDRLAAARGAYSSDDLSLSMRDSPPNNSPLTGENVLSVGSPKTSLSAFTDSLSHLKSQTKSFIKTIKEKNILMAKSTSSPMLTTLVHQQQRPLKDESSSLQQIDDQQERTTENQEANSKKIKEAAVASLDIAMLCQTARDIQKTLSSPATLLNPRLLVRVLNEWARELNGVMVAYHQELIKMQYEHSKNDEKPTNSGNPTSADEDPDFSDGALNSEVSDDIVEDGTSRSCENKCVPSALNDSSLLSQTPHHELHDSPIPCLTPRYWSSIIHSKDPFHIPDQQLELVKTLTTLCFISGATGNILNFLGFTKVVHLNEFLKSFLPVSLISSYDPLSEKFSMRSHYLVNSSGHIESTVNKQLDIEDTGSKILTYTSAELKKDNEVSTFADNQVNTALNGVNCSETRPRLTYDETRRPQEHKLDTTAEDPKPIGSCDGSNTKLDQSVFTDPSIERDLSLALFTRLYFFAFDYERLKHELDYQETNLFITWASFLQCSHEKGSDNIVGSILSDKQFNSAFDYLRSGILPQQSALLGHIYELLDQVPAKTSDFCGEIYKQVTPNDLLCLCALCSKPASTCLLRYVRQVMIDLATVQRSEVFSHMCKRNRDMRYIFLEALLSTLAQDVTSFEPTKSLASQVLSVLPSDWLKSILSMIDSDEEREDIVTLSINTEYWPITMKLLCQSNQWQRLLQLIVQIDDIKLLTGTHGEDAYIPKNIDEWKYLLKCYVEKQSADAYYHAKPETVESELSLEVSLTDNSPKMDRSSLSLANEKVSDMKKEDTELVYESFITKSGTKRHSYQGEAITWNSLGNLLLKYVGGALTIELLMNYLKDQEMARNCLSTEFLNACYVDFSLKIKQDHVTHEMLEKMSAYMWAKKPGFVPPSVFNAITKENSMMEKGDGDVDALQIVFNQVQSLDVHELMSEHLGGHWGQEVDISSPCLLCNIPLKSIMSLTVQGVVVFPCKHAFHKCCVSGPTCPVLH